MNLAIDIGNTRVKTAVFKDTTLIQFDYFPLNFFLKNVNGLIAKFPIVQAIVSSVGISKKDYQDFNNKSIKIWTLNHQTKIPFINKYETPQTLGVDRIALIAAATNKYPNKNVLVIDAGSCITYDFINDKKEYFGGSISPGIEMRYKSLHNYTSNLPLLTAINQVPLVGDSSQKAIHMGVLNGVIHEIEGVIGRYQQENNKLTVVLTGGDTIFLAKNIKSTIFANPNFLLEGLNSILIYNNDV